MNSVLVTGGAGFIGSHIVRELVKRGHEVRVIDSMKAGDRGNLDGLMSKVGFVEGDIRDIELLKRSCRGIDCIFHEAALTSVTESMKSPLECNDFNVTGSLNLLEAARSNGVGRIVYASSSAVYGDAAELPIREDAQASPLSPYAVTKIVMEKYFAVFERVYGIRSFGLRYFNVYGPGQDPDSEYSAVIPRFISLLAHGRRPVIYGDGEQTRDFVFVSDVVRANMIAMESREMGGVFNIASGEATTVNSLLKTLGRIMGRDIEPEHAGPREGDIMHSVADVSRARERLGFIPEHSLEQGLRKTADWFVNEG